MDIHKPKPWHGWREFLKEYLIIVVGVLTALAGEQLVEWLHTRHEIAEATGALRAEISENATRGLVGSEQNKCLLVFAKKSIAWAQGGPRPPQAMRTRTGMSSVVWDASKSGALLRMPQEERLKYAGFYAFIAGAGVLERQVQDALIATMRYTRLERLNSRQAESLEEEMNALVPLIAGLVVDERNTVRLARQMGVEPKAAAGNRVKALCQAVGAPPPTFEVSGDSASDYDWFDKVAARAESER